MIQLSLQALPNQSFSVTLDDDFYDITVHQAYDTMCATIVKNNELILSGQRIIPGFPIIPYLYRSISNFVLTTLNDALPDYSQFNVSQFLVYASSFEVLAILEGA